ncbi:hypothetical protein [Pedobacter psychroterrae]|uniref:Uncharacterized protein n=1 Tax=Pedobacter psychroterrae TaxID=2530453 RepID=A0A4R0NMV4_9SPHI|nr:hypothetical protein [Pedobacter psychroterrae]TCD01258.1 hypothetical protein EZ437_10915 [Pedobacter psychroterrae]
MRRMSLIISWLLFLNLSANSQSLDSLDQVYADNWIARAKYANLKFNVPDNFKIFTGVFLNNARWPCDDLFNINFDRVLVNKDSSILIAVQVMANYQHVTPSGDKIDKKVDWVQNVKNHYSFRADTLMPKAELDSEMLSRRWDAKYGVLFSRKKCNVPFLGRYGNNKVFLFANDYRQAFIVYFYKDEKKPQIEKVVNNTLHVLEKL